MMGVSAFLKVRGSIREGRVGELTRISIEETGQTMQKGTTPSRWWRNVVSVIIPLSPHTLINKLATRAWLSEGGSRPRDEVRGLLDVTSQRRDVTLATLRSIAPQ